jgi:hypothetical protein
MPGLFGLFSRKKKQAKKDGGMIAGSGYSADADAVLRNIQGKTKKTTMAPKSPERPKDPNVPVEKMGALADELLEIERERKRKAAQKGK